MLNASCSENCRGAVFAHKQGMPGHGKRDIARASSKHRSERQCRNVLSVSSRNLLAIQLKTNFFPQRRCTVQSSASSSQPSATSLLPFYLFSPFQHALSIPITHPLPHKPLHPYTTKTILSKPSSARFIHLYTHTSKVLDEAVAKEQ